MTVPGDLLVKVGHVVIIQNITATEENGVLKVKNYSDVKVIHSASGIQGAWKTWQVHKGNWTQIHGDTDMADNKGYALRRLITQ